MIEELKSKFESERAVSPVIGIILMVAITVILAAVIGTFVLGLGNKVSGSTAPQVNWKFEDNATGGNTTIIHNGGDAVKGENLITYVNGNQVSNSGTYNYADGDGWTGEVSAANSEKISGVSSGDTVKLIWKSPDDGSTQTLATHEVQ